VLRALLLGLVGLGALGLLIELTLLEHWMAAPQFVPLLTLVAALSATVAVAVRPGHTTVSVFRGIMAVAVLAGLVGIGFHFFDNWAFEREVSPDASMAALLWPVLQGATPLLAPGSLLQLGLAGLVTAYRHPALLPSDPPAGAGDPLRTEDNQ